MYERTRNNTINNKTGSVLLANIVLSGLVVLIFSDYLLVCTRLTCLERVFVLHKIFLFLVFLFHFGALCMQRSPEPSRRGERAGSLKRAGPRRATPRARLSWRG